VPPQPSSKSAGIVPFDNMLASISRWSDQPENARSFQAPNGMKSSVVTESPSATASVATLYQAPGFAEFFWSS
jgi:hypothetical protein